MKIVAISDTHGLHRKLTIPSGDILVHAGDITRKGELETVDDFAKWLASLPHRHKIVIAGNHDHCLDIAQMRFDATSRRLLEDRGIHYLLDASRTLHVPWGPTLKFYGAPWVPNLALWAFDDRNRDRFERAPTDIDVLITHSPPIGIRDGTGQSRGHVGSHFVKRYVERCPRLKLHIFGHVHEGYGRSDLGEITFVNAASCTRAYELMDLNAPIVIDIDDATWNVLPAVES